MASKRSIRRFGGDNIATGNAFMWDLVKRVRAGTLIPAAFQRPYVWAREDVEAFWGSLIDGFPLGSVMLWTPHDAYDITKVARGRLGPIQADNDRPAGVILDGQNRLATIAWSMWTPDQTLPDALSPQEAATWASGMLLVADGGSETVSFVPAAEAETGLRVPIGILCQFDRYNRYMREHYDRLDAGGDDLDHVFDWFDHCRNRVQEARLVVTDIQGATPEEAKHAFLRICRVGVPMSEEDFDGAMAWDEEPPAPGL